MLEPVEAWLGPLSRRALFLGRVVIPACPSHDPGKFGRCSLAGGDVQRSGVRSRTLFYATLEVAVVRSGVSGRTATQSTNAIA